jgi:hypothetical protein
VNVIKVRSKGEKMSKFKATKKGKRIIVFVLTLMMMVTVMIPLGVAASDEDPITPPTITTPDATEDPGEGIDPDADVSNDNGDNQADLTSPEAIDTSSPPFAPADEPEDSAAEDKATGGIQTPSSVPGEEEMSEAISKAKALVTTQDEPVGPTVHVTTIGGIKAALSNPDVKEIILDETIYITTETKLEGNGQLIRVPTPGTDEAGVIQPEAQNDSKFDMFDIGTGGNLIVNNIRIKGGSWNVFFLHGTSPLLKLTNVTATQSGSVLVYGGVINNVGGTVVAVDCSFSRNVARKGGVYFAQDSAKGLFDRCTFSENRNIYPNDLGTFGGGAIENSLESTLWLNNCTVANNQAHEIGGGINNIANSTIYLINTSVVGNMSTWLGDTPNENANMAKGAGLSIGNHGWAGKDTGVPSKAYLLNSIVLDNYANVRNKNTENGGSDIGVGYSYNGVTQQFFVYNSLYKNYWHHANGTAAGANIPVETPVHDTALDVSDIFARYSSAKYFNPTGIVNSSSNLFIRPTLYGGAAPLKNDASSPAVTGGMDTYFSYNDALTSVNLGYKDGNGTIQSLTGNGAAAPKVAVYQTKESRTSGVMGPVGPTGAKVANYTVKVVWQDNVHHGTVNGASIFENSYKPGTKIEIAAVPDETYWLEGWKDVTEMETDSTIQLEDIPYLSTDDILKLTVDKDYILMPIFSLAPTPSWHLKYVGTGSTAGEAPADSIIDKSDVVAVNDKNTLSRVVNGEEWFFMGWNTKEDGSGVTYEPGSRYVFTHPDPVLIFTPENPYTETVYAQWHKPYSVSFTAGNGGSFASGKTVFKGIFPGTLWKAVSGFAVPTPVPAKGYYFVGWNKEIISANTAINSDLTYTALFAANPISPKVKYTVKFKDYDGTVIKTQTVIRGKNATAPANPSRSGYTFTGWDKGYTNVKSDLIVTAKYTPNFQPPPLDGDWPIVPPLDQDWPVVTPPPLDPPIVTPPAITPTAPAIEEPQPPQPQDPPVTTERETGVAEPEASAAADTFNADDLAKISKQTGNPLSDIANGYVPRGDFKTTGAWSILSLLFSLIAIVVAVLLIVFAVTGRNKKAHGRLFRALAIIAGILTPVIWFILDKLNQPMVWINQWTIYVGIVFIITMLLTVIYNIRKNSDNDFEERQDMVVQ